jgi:hypothetical protein
MIKCIIQNYTWILMYFLVRWVVVFILLSGLLSQRNQISVGVFIQTWIFVDIVYHVFSTLKYIVRFRMGMLVKVLNATFNNTSVISWWLVLLVEATGVPAEIHRPTASHWQALSDNIVSSTPRHERDSYSQL